MLKPAELDFPPPNPLQPSEIPGDLRVDHHRANPAVIGLQTQTTGHMSTLTSGRKGQKNDDQFDSGRRA
ncbi:hypothetical protein PtA15_4A713 [Puccinia triticina]|uniref:Uncharacterized protein n=1 Tax=Puccinia triticina TaxID=208348 RepID=A0ABY7CKC9_9BASI|nr:uncharacterized protein PtA15_4A713 [Puccinia triticina]WAQ84260.1 hypothetical protein PtA15_4A713 [Puccinia triticina]